DEVKKDDASAKSDEVKKDDASEKADEAKKDDAPEKADEAKKDDASEKPESMHEDGTENTTENNKKTKKKMIFIVIVLCVLGCGVVTVLYINRDRGTTVHATGIDTAGMLEKIIGDAFVSRWVETEDVTYYYVDGVPATGWMDIEGDTYYFDEEGVMVTNRMIERNCYVGEDGKLVPVADIRKYEKEGLKELKKILEDTIDGYRGTCSIYVKNLDTNEYLSIKDEQIKSASLIKIYSMATVYDEIEKGNLEEDSAVTNYLHNMITVSDNGAFNHLLYVLGDGNGREGTKLITKYCEENGFSDTGCGGTLSSAETGFSSIWLFTNYTSTKDCGHLFEDIYRGTLISEKASEEMLDLLMQQEWRMKIPAGLPEGVVCANKTGEYDDRQHDTAIVYSDGADYVISVMTDGDGAAISHIQHISSVVYDYFNKK
ncbi:MAG: serine hydrolase, partial [Lachnospiraceae bacterium]